MVASTAYPECYQEFTTGSSIHTHTHTPGMLILAGGITMQVDQSGRGATCSVRH